MEYLKYHDTDKETTLFGRYITLDDIEPLLLRYNAEVVGKSVLGKPIYKYQIGLGKTRILMWSQMHGNESTTTKALCDFINVLNSNSEEISKLLNAFTFCMLPMVNPDGAKLYTRENANGIDLNRDAQCLSQPESKILRKVFEDFQPNYCYNLHDQRTIYGVDTTGKPATVSFLAPAYNESRDVNEVRLKAMELIVAMNNTLQHYIPSQVGRFDDSFNLNCVGDTFQFMKVPTILFEAGHFAADYDRESTRKYIFIALLSSIHYLHENDIVSNKNEDYMQIPQNKVVFYDFVYKNVKINYDSIEKISNFAAQYEEVCKNNKILFEAKIVEIGNLENCFGHVTFEAKGEKYTDDHDNFPNIGSKADFYIGKQNKFVNGLLCK